MRVYRIEDQEGFGIYTSRLGFDCTRAAIRRDDGEKIGDDDHPGPEYDEGLAKWWQGPGKRGSSKNIAWHNDPLTGRRQWICGFLSEAQMLDWFPRDGFHKMVQEIQKGRKKGWEERGWHVAVYDVHANRVRKGKFQAMFRFEDAKLVRKIELSHYAAFNA